MDNLAQALLATTDDVLEKRNQPKHRGEALVIALYRTFKAASFYDRRNPSFQHLVYDALSAITRILDEAGQLETKLIRDAYFCNNTLVRVTAMAYGGYKGWMQELALRRIGSLRFHHGVTAADVMEFIFLLHELEADDEGNPLLLNERLIDAGVTTIDVGPLIVADEEAAHGDVCETDPVYREAKGVYFSTIGIIKEVLADSRERPLQLRKAKRLMLNAVDLVVRDESALLGLTNIKSYDDYTFNHSVNVAIYAIALGNRIGLPKKFLNYLGIAGLFHDLGKTDISLDILHKPGPLTSEEWRVVRDHPLRGAETILRLKGWGPLSARLITAAFEHHLKYDCSGYPGLEQKRKASLFSRIITIADCYDALGRPRVYRQTPYVTEKILAMMLQESGRQFDPTLVKIFINMVGVYPLGTLVLLNTNEIGVVMRTPRSDELVDRPEVLLLERTADSYRKGGMIDLAERDESGAFPRHIVETLNPNNYNLRIEEFFI